MSSRGPVSPVGVARYHHFDADLAGCYLNLENEGGYCDQSSRCLVHRKPELFKRVKWPVESCSHASNDDTDDLQGLRCRREGECEFGHLSQSRRLYYRRSTRRLLVAEGDPGVENTRTTLVSCTDALVKLSGRRAELSNSQLRLETKESGRS